MGNRIVNIALAVTLIVVFGVLSYLAIKNAVFEPIIVEKPVYIDKVIYDTIEKPVYLDKIIEVEKIITINNTIEKIVYEKYPVRNFKDLAEFAKWVQDKMVRIWLISGEEADCDDYAEHLQSEALKEGYMVSCQVVYNGMLGTRQVSDSPGLHMGNLVIIGNDIYWVEPQSSAFSIVKVCDRD